MIAASVELTSSQDDEHRLPVVLLRGVEVVVRGQRQHRCHCADRRMSLFQSWEKKNRSGPIAPMAVNFSHFCITFPQVAGHTATGNPAAESSKAPLASRSATRRAV